MEIESCITPNTPIDRLVKLVADFLFINLEGPDLEIELKFGLLIDKKTEKRIHFPSETEMILKESYVPNIVFHSDMSANMHKKLNKFFNYRVSETNQPDYPGAKCRYEHIRETDYFYQTKESRIRVSKDDATGKVLQCIEKQKISHLHIHMPFAPLDCRITFSREINQPAPQGEPTSFRKKDRLSYLHQLFRFDLTQVKSQEKISHELEVEIDVEFMLQEKQKIMQQQPNQFLEMATTLVNNLRAITQFISH